MKNEFTPYEQALALKELGFDEPCFGSYCQTPKFDEGTFMLGNTYNLKAPTFSQAFRWFREKYDLFGCIDLHACTPAHWYVRIDDIIKNDYVYHSGDENVKYNTYEEAELACLIKLIEIVKQQNYDRKNN